MSLPAALREQIHFKPSHRRRTVGLQVGPAGIQVNYPATMPQAELLALLDSRAQWLQSRLTQQQQRLGPTHSFGPGDVFYYLGQPLVLELYTGSQTRVWQTDTALCVCLSRRTRNITDQKVRSLILTWYADCAQREFEQRARAMAARIGCQVTSVGVKYTRSKWGHCTADGRLQFNPLVLQAAPDIVDYLVAHEVSHLRHLNHSKAFWSQVGALCPHYGSARQWLRQHGFSLVL